MLDGIPIPQERAVAAKGVAAVLTAGRRVALTTHVNADGDGVGSEVALWHLLTARGLKPAIANPTPVPERFAFLLPTGADHSDRSAKEIEAADVVVVLDIAELSRLGDLQRAGDRAGMLDDPSPVVRGGAVALPRVRGHGHPRQADARLDHEGLQHPRHQAHAALGRARIYRLVDRQRAGQGELSVDGRRGC